MEPLDLVIRGATILDGSGTPRFVADVAIQDGKIHSIQHDYLGPATTVVEAEGQFLAPGFIDSHCHDDLAMLRHPGRPEKVAQGVTTVVVGNCGFSLYPYRSHSKAAVQSHAAGLLGSLRDDEVFENFTDYRDTLLRKGIVINVVSLVGHGPLRLTAVGNDDRLATEQEISDMESLLRKQLDDGAAGLSLGLVYPPSAYAGREELIRLSRVAAECGKPVAAHIRSYEAGLLDATNEFVDILRESGARGILSHLQAAGRPNWSSVGKVLEALEAACESGVDICFDMYPYLAGSSYALQLLPPSALSGGVEALKLRLGSSTYRAELSGRIQEIHPGADGWQSKIALIGWESVLIAGVEAPALKSLEGQTMRDFASELGVDPFDLLVRLVLEDDGASAVILFQLSEDDLRSAFTHPLHMVGSDGIPRDTGRPHPRAFGTFPRVIHKLAGEAGWFSLEEAVRRMTSRTAERLGISCRGLVRPGYVADLILFGREFQDVATFQSPTARAVGASHVWIGGQAILFDGVSTVAQPGLLIA